jgi:hypothetical protein
VHSEDAAYQSRHLSIQEYLCAEFFKQVVLSDQQAALPTPFEHFDLSQWRSGKAHQANALREPFNANFFELASSIDDLPVSAFPGAADVGSAV